MAETTSPWEPIPGETPIDISFLKIAGITNRNELNEVEAENILEAFLKYAPVRPHWVKFEFTWCLKLHEEMFGKVWKWAGQIRRRNLNIGVNHAAIANDLAMLLEDLRSWPKYKMDFIEQAARLHHRAVFIHPFENGNGRWARLLANIWLKYNEQPMTDWPEAAIHARSEIRAQYIASIISADNGDYTELIALHRKYAEQSENEE